MKNPIQAFVSEPSMLKRFRLILIALLTVTVVSSAALAIFMIVTGASDENLWKVTGTFGLFAGFSLIMLLQTSSLYREEILDKIVSALGFLSSGALVFWALDGIWSWEVVVKIFGENYELLGKTMSSLGLTTAFTVVVGLLRGSLRINKIVKGITFGIAGLSYTLWMTRVWAPEWFSREITETYVDEFNKTQSYTYMEEIEFWSDTFLILGILLGMMLVVSLVSHIIGGRKEIAVKLDKPSKDMVQLTVKKETADKIERLAKERGKDTSSMLDEVISNYYQ